MSAPSAPIGDADLDLTLVHLLLACHWDGAHVICRRFTILIILDVFNAWGPFESATAQTANHRPKTTRTVTAAPAPALAGTPIAASVTSALRSRLR